MAKDHPRRDRDGYVLEHILVMENMIGRLLDRQEVVHHINKDKSDNSPENLMLFPNHATHLRYERDLIGRKTTLVRCDTCGNQFWKRNCAIKKYNFCSRKCVRPGLWTPNKQHV